MGIMDKIMGMTKKKDKFELPKLDLGKEPDIGAATHGMEPTDLGGTGDATPGLGGTGDLGGTADLGGMTHHEEAPQEETIHGFGHEDVKKDPTELRQHEQQSFSKPTMMQESRPPEPAISTKDLEIISSKLDTLRATLEMINNRLSTIESQMNEQKRRGGW